MRKIVLTMALLSLMNSAHSMMVAEGVELLSSHS